jgi:hypothetical protein
MTANLHQQILAAMPATVEEIAALLAVSPKCISHRLRRYRDNEWAHIGDWQRTTGKPAAVWHEGLGTDMVYVLRTPKKRRTGPVSAESIVCSAMAYQPNSIFAMGDRARA